MFFLFMAIISSASIALIFKYSESKGLNRYYITSYNYVMAIIISLVLTIIQWPGVVKIIQGSTYIIWLLLLTGIPAGLFFYLSFIYYQKSVEENGATLSGMFGKLGILIPMIVSILFWRELPEKIQWMGIFLSLLGIIVVYYQPNSKTKLKLSLLMLLFYGGMADLSNKIFQKYFVMELKSLFLLILFTSAFIFSVKKAKKQVHAPKRSELVTGFMVGLPNLLSSLFLIKALGTVTTSLAFPIFSAGTIVLISVGSLIFYKEKISMRGWVGIVLTISAVILINI
ncbi:MAG: SMR family transporter [Dehalobacterium sp.]